MNVARPSATTRPPWIRWVAAGLATYSLLFTLYTLLQPLGEEGRLIVGDLVYIPSSLVAGALCLLILRATQDHRLRWAWGLIGLGLLSWAMADTLWAWYELVLGVLPEPPHLTDIFYLITYPLFFAGLLIYPTARWNWLNRAKLLLDVSIIAVATAIFGWYYLVTPILGTEAQNTLGRLIELAYPVGDLVLIWALARIYFAAPRTAASAAILMLIAGIGLNVVADVWYAFLSPQGLYYTGHLVDALWVWGSACVGGAALAQYRALSVGGQIGPSPSRSSQRLREHVQHFLPYILLVPVSILEIREVSALITPNLPEWGLLLGGWLMIVLIVARQIVTLGESDRLNAELAQRIEEITLLNGQMRQVNEKLQEVDRLKSELVSNVSHELRTPLTNILGYTDLLLESSSDPPTPFQAEGLRIVHRNGHRLLNLVNDLLDVSRLESGRFSIEPAPLSMAALLRQLTEEARLQAAQKGLTLATDLSDGLPVVLADGPRVAQVVNNLLANAIKFTPPGGQVTVSCYRLEGEGGSLKSILPFSSGAAPELPPGRWLVVTVADTGIGIPADELPHLFSRFYRAPEAQRQAIRGAGLGLYVAKAIVEAHGGRIGVESQPGRGSIFWFALPAEADDLSRQGDDQRISAAQMG